MRIRIAWTLGAVALLLFACVEEPPFELAVTFVGPLEIQAGAEVRYQGVTVGKVDAISLRQPEPQQPALVELSLSIHDRDITLREGDLFEVVSDGLLGDDYVRVTAARKPSAPLASGSTIGGRAPFLTRVLESADQALGSLGELAREQRDEWIDAVREAAREETPAEAEDPL